MISRRINLCFYPTTVILIDDSKEFLKKLEFKLNKYFPLNIYDSPSGALKYFNDEYKSFSFVDRCIRNNNEDNTDYLMQNVNIRSIHQEIYNPKRFSEITVVIIDYAMPNLNGLEFSRQLKKKYPYIKIVLLTGEADQSLAVEAFNEGIINKFIMKSAENLASLILDSIRELQKQYFNYLSEMCLSDVSQFKGILHCLTDSAFIEVFEKICQDNNITEYYLMDNQGSFLLLDNMGNPSWLAVKTEQEMEQFYQFAILEQAPKSVIDKLKSRESVLYFHTDDDLKLPPQQWEKYLYPAQKLMGKETYFYAYINKPAAYDIQPEKIISYQEYLDKID